MMFKKLVLMVGFMILASELNAYQQATGRAQASHADADECVIAAPGAGKVLFLTDVMVFVSTAAVGGGGEVALEDGAGGTRLWEMDADASGAWPIHFEEPGYPLTANTCLNITVDGAVTTQATAGAIGRANVGR